jgi:hypothetical protein
MSYRPPTWLLVLDALVVAVIAVLTHFCLCTYYGWRLPVRGGSMQPVLHGDPNDGDVVFVDLTVRAESLSRHDLVVVQHPNNPGQPIVKRIAACGDDVSSRWIDIVNGEIKLGDSPQRCEFERKDPLKSRMQRVRWADTAVPASASLLDLRGALKADGEWRLAPVAAVADEVRSAFRGEAIRLRRAALDGPRLPQGCIGTSRAVDAGYLTVTGKRPAVGTDVTVWDCGMELELAGAAVELLATIENHGEALTFHWLPAQRRVVLWRNGENQGEHPLPVASAQHVEFGRLDGRLWFCLDQRADALFIVPRAPDWNTDDEKGKPRSVVHVAAVGAADAALRIRRLTVFHDVFAYRDPIASMPGQPAKWPCEVPPGHWFLLGDSAFDSRDSRQFGAVPASSLLGVPTRVLGPWSRRRSLRP